MHRLAALAALAALLFPLALSAGPAGEFRPLWDGRTFEGWRVIGKGRWEMVDGAIRGTQQKGEAAFGHLITDREFTNFIVRVKYKAVRGNSGLYFRIEEKGYSGVSGFQAEIDPDHDAGGLYETNGRSWVSKPKAADVKRWFKPGEWNEMTVTARGGDVSVTVNGIQSAVLKNDPGRRHGRIALQVHGGQDVEVWFRDLEVSELKTE